MLNFATIRAVSSGVKHESQLIILDHRVKKVSKSTLKKCFTIIVNKKEFYSVIKIQIIVFFLFV